MPEAGVEPLASEIGEEERDVLVFLRESKRVDIRWLGEEQKTNIRTVLDRLHNEKKMSLLRISKEVGRSYTAIWGLCRALQIRTRTVAEADRESAASRSKHKRVSFHGTEEERAYMLGLKNGDLTAWQVSGTAVMVTSTTTHPAFVALFRDLFQSYGHVYEYPMYEEGKGYKWKVATRLDNSFQFLLASAQDAVRDLQHNRRLFLSWVAGLLDADGHVNIGIDRKYVRVRLDFGSVDRPLLVSVKEVMKSYGYFATGPYLGYQAGFTTPRGITYRSDMWRLDIQRTHEAQRMLLELPIRHLEKTLRKELALSMKSQKNLDDASARLDEIRSTVRRQVAEYLEEARRKYGDATKRKRKLE